MKQRNKCITNRRISLYGGESLLDEEVISLLTGIRIQILDDIIKRHGLAELIKYINILHVTKAQKQKLILLYSFTRRVNTSMHKQRQPFTSCKLVGEYFVQEMQFEANEVFYIAILDTQKRLIDKILMSRGTIDEVTIYPREIVKLALNNNAASIILAHNHPGGESNPSKFDIEVTRIIKKALNPIGINLLDHFIIFGNQYQSMARCGLLDQ